MTQKQAARKEGPPSRAQSLQHRPSQPSHQIRSVLAEATSKLVTHGVDTAHLDAETLLAHALTLTRAQLLARLSSSISLVEQEAFQHLLARRLRREPLAYITGKREFWSREFAVTPEVLIPRPETELLIETVLRLVAQSHTNSLQPPMRVLDIGTGSGCIAITLAKELPTVELWAVDLSSAALTIALANARHHGVEQRINFLQGDLFSAIPEDSRFDVVVSNPPYIARDELTALQPEVRDWEPQAALDGGNDGLAFYRRLVNDSPKHLRPSGWLIMELGAGQCSIVMRLIQAQSNFRESFCVQDYAGFNRVIAARSCA